MRLGYSMTMKRFAFLAARPSTAADIREDEWEAVKRFGNLSDDDMVYFSLEDRPRIDPTEYAGIFVSGSQYGFVDEHDIKTPEQIATEEVLFAVNDIVLEHDIPYLGLCYGHQSLAVSLNEELTGDYFEELTTVQIEVTEEGKKDPIFGRLPDSFPAILGHAESIGVVPRDTVVLASSPNCPVQAIRHRNNVYGVQFHPEIDVESLEIRLDYYNGSKYFAPGELDVVRARTSGFDYSSATDIIRGFVDTYRDRSTEGAS